MPPDANALQNHLAFEVHWLVYAAVRFRDTEGRDQVVFQDSAFLHARNILELTGPGSSNHGWRIHDLGGATQRADATWNNWSDLINSKVTHLGDGRLKNPTWPVTENKLRCIEMSRYFLERLSKAAAEKKDQRMKVAEEIAKLGLRYLDCPDPATLEQLAKLVDAS